MYTHLMVLKMFSAFLLVDRYYSFPNMFYFFRSWRCFCERKYSCVAIKLWFDFYWSLL